MGKVPTVSDPSGLTTTDDCAKADAEMVSAATISAAKRSSGVIPPPFRPGAPGWRVADRDPGGRAAPLPAIGPWDIGEAGSEERSHFVKSKNYAKVC